MDLFKEGVRAANALEGMVEAFLRVECLKRRGLLVVILQADLERGFVVILALDEGGTAAIADAILGRLSTASAKARSSKVSLLRRW